MLAIFFAQVEFTRAGLRDPLLIRLDVENKISKDLKVIGGSICPIATSLVCFELRCAAAPAARPWRMLNLTRCLA